MVDYPLRLDLPQVGRAITFRNDKELKQWCDKEVQSWAWTSPFSFSSWRNSQGYQEEDPLGSRFKRRLNNIQNAININNHDQMVDALLKAFQKDGFPSAHSADGKLILGISALSPEMGAGALYASTFSARPTNGALEAGAIMFWAKKSKALDFSADAAMVQDAVLQLTTAHQEIATENANRHHRQTNQSVRYLKRLRATRRSIHQAISAAHTASVDSIREVENQYLSQMTLRAPVSYWRDRSESHARQFRRMAIASAIYAAAALLGIGLGGFLFLRLEVARIVKSGTPVQIIFVELSVFLMLATIVFWVGRVLSKILLSERHLASDAAERAVMAETYLALQHEGALSESERPLVLGALFRSSNDGIVKDEGGLDPSVVALLAKALSPGGAR